MYSVKKIITNQNGQKTEFGTTSKTPLEIGTSIDGFGRTVEIISCEKAETDIFKLFQAEKIEYLTTRFKTINDH